MGPMVGKEVENLDENLVRGDDQPAFELMP
jgi:hypothetical protein